MLKIVIVSDDFCETKLIINTINEIKVMSSIEVCDSNDFINKYNINNCNNNKIYIVDIYNIESNFLTKVKEIKLYLYY